jgi:hypothetical protein
MESDKKIGDAVVLNYGVSGLLRNCFIIAVKFTDHKVKYDVKIYPFPDEEENKNHFHILVDIDSYFVEKPEDRFTGKSHMPLILE